MNGRNEEHGGVPGALERRLREGLRREAQSVQLDARAFWSRIAARARKKT
jgi:hypothetical protein